MKLEISFERVEEMVLCILHNDLDEDEAYNYAKAFLLEINHPDYAKCIDEFETDNGVEICCKLGLWSVSGPDSDSVYVEAFNYWQQYASDGEYSSIIGGESVIEKLTKK